MLAKPVVRALVFCIPAPSTLMIACYVVIVGSGGGTLVGWVAGRVASAVQGEPSAHLRLTLLIVGAVIGIVLLGIHSMWQLETPFLSLILLVPNLVLVFLLFWAYFKLDPMVERLRLKVQGRLIDRDELEEKLLMTKGTLIEEVDHYWVRRIWWTDDYIPVCSLDPKDPVNCRIRREYLHTRRGKAHLTDLLEEPSLSQAEELRRKFPGVRIVQAGCWA
jgi:hypothetical protein